MAHSQQPQKKKMAKAKGDDTTPDGMYVTTPSGGFADVYA
jgi:hypothetical protein